MTCCSLLLKQSEQMFLFVGVPADQPLSKCGEGRVFSNGSFLYRFGESLTDNKRNPLEGLGPLTNFLDSGTGLAKITLQYPHFLTQQKVATW